MTDPWARPANQVPPGPPPPQFPQSAPGQAAPPPQAEPPQKGSSPLVKIKKLFRDPLSIVLIAVIVVALVAAGVLAAELYARSRANDVVAAATECVVQDDVTVSFGATPFLLQHMTGHYGNISIETAGNQIRDAKGMKAQVNIDDVRLQSSGNSKGTIGALDATITWTADGIKQTVQNAIPLVGSFVTGVTTNPSDGTIELEAALGQHHHQTGGAGRRDRAAGGQPERPGLHPAARDGAARAGRLLHPADQRTIRSAFTPTTSRSPIPV